MLHCETLAPATLKLAERLLAFPELSDARLVGGTALALQFGHRISVDLDIFGAWDAHLDLEALFSGAGSVVHTAKAPRMDFFAIDGVKVDCINYPYPWMALYRKKYAGANEYIVSKSLTYFDDAEKQPMPVMRKPFDWKKAKAAIVSAVEAYVQA